MALTQVLVGGANGITLNSDGYGPLVGFPWANQDTPMVTDGEVIYPANIFPMAGTLKNFRVWCSYVTGMNASNKMVITILKNNVATTMTVTFDGIATQFKEDTTHTVAVSAGDFITIYMNETGATFGEYTWTADFETTAFSRSIHCGGSLGVGTPDGDDDAQSLEPGETQYFAPCGQGPYNYNDVRKIVMPCSGTIKDFYFGISTISGASTHIFTVMKNGVATSITATASTANNVVSDTTNSATVAVGDLISVRVATSGDFADLNCASFVFEADEVGYYPIFGTADIREDHNPQVATTSRYISGRTYRTDWAVAPPTSGYAQCDQLANAMSVRGITVYKSGTLDSRDYTLYNKGVATALTVTVSGVTVASATGTVAIANNDAICTIVEGAGDSPVWEAISYLVYDSNVGTAPLWYNQIGEYIEPPCGYIGQVASTSPDLSHLPDGQVVAILANGVVLEEQTISSGAIVVPSGYSKLTVGLPYYADFETLNIEVPLSEGTVQAQRVKVSNVTMRLDKSRGGHIGPDEDNLWEAFTPSLIRESTGKDYSDTELITDDIRMVLDGQYETGGRVFYRQVDPLPITIGAVIPEVDIGGISR